MFLGHRGNADQGHVSVQGMQSVVQQVGERCPYRAAVSRRTPNSRWINAPIRGLPARYAGCRHSQTRRVPPFSPGPIDR